MKFVNSCGAARGSASESFSLSLYPMTKLCPFFFCGLGFTPCNKVGLMAITVHAIYAATNLMHECACHTTSLRTTSLACIRRQLTCAFNVPYVQRFPASNAVPRSELLHCNFVHLFSVRVAERCLLFNGSFHGHLSSNVYFAFP